MSSIDWKIVETIVDEVLELPDKKNWLEFVEKRCGRSPEVKSEVTELLESIFDSEGWLENPDAYRADLIDSSLEDSLAESRIGDKFGAYAATEIIAQGGMGAVYRGERTDGEFDHTVAIKVIRVGMDTRENIRLFNRERNILAGLNHPGIAKLFDGGVLENGAPYLIMEYVEGIPIDQYCDDHKLTVDERIDLFKDVLKAVRHAHENLIIHRDLKPDNILITEQGQVKILDFGISKLLDTENATADENITQARILTPKYAAPEQIRQQSITTATDLYSLGIIFYQLLVGRHPYDLKDKSAYEMETTVLNNEPILPGRRLSQDDKASQLAKKRSSTTRDLVNKLQGDLDAILLKSIEKDPGKRYRTSDSLLDEFNRYISGLPVSARQRTVRYRANKFIRRNKTPLAVTVTFLTLILSFAFYHTQQITKERNQAQLEAKKAQEVTGFLADMFRASDPMYESDEIPTATVLLERGETRIKQLDDQPAIQAQLLGVIGNAYESLAQYNKALPLLTKALTLRKQLYAPNSPEIAEGLGALAVLNRKMGNFSAAESLHTQALAIRKSSLGEFHLQTSESLNDLGVVLSARGKYEASDSSLQKALKIKEEIYGRNHSEVGRVLSNIASNKRFTGQHTEAEELYQEAIDIWETQHEDNHPYIAEGIHDLAFIKSLRGNTKEADSLYRKSLEIHRKSYEEPHPKIALTMNNLGTFLGKNGDFEKAEPFLEDALKMRRALYHDQNHPEIAESLNNLGRLYIETGKYEQAKILLKEALEIDIKKYDDMHPYVGGDLRNLGLISKKQGDYKEAEDYFRRSLEIFQERLPENHTYNTETLTNLGEILIYRDNAEEAQRILHRLLKIQSPDLSDGNWEIARTNVLLGISYYELNEYKLAESLLKDGYENLKEVKGPGDEYMQKARNYLDKL